MFRGFRKAALLITSGCAMLLGYLFSFIPALQAEPIVFGYSISVWTGTVTGGKCRLANAKKCKDCRIAIYEYEDIFGNKTKSCYSIHCPDNNDPVTFAVCEKKTGETCSISGTGSGPETCKGCRVKKCEVVGTNPSTCDAGDANKCPCSLTGGDLIGGQTEVNVCTGAT